MPELYNVMYGSAHSTAIMAMAPPTPGLLFERQDDDGDEEDHDQANECWHSDDDNDKG